MKKILIISSIILIVLLTVIGISCKKDILVKENPFEVELVYKQEIVLNEKANLEIEIKPEQVVSSTKYSFKYKILSGNGFFEKDGKKVEQNNIIELGSVLSSLKFIPTEIGNLQVEIEFSDNKNQINKKTITYNCDYYSSQFTFTAVAVSDYALINETVAINFNLDGPTNEKSNSKKKSNNISDNTQLDKSLKSNETDKGTTSYTLRFDVQSGSGVFIYNSVEYTEGQIISIQPGTFTGKYKGTNAGTNEVTFTVTNDNETPKSESSTINIEYGYYQSDFNIVITPDQTDMLVGTTTNINFNLTEILKEEVTYTMKFTNSLSGVFTYNGTEYNVGQNIVILPGESQGTYKGETDGANTIQFTITNSNHEPESHTAGILLNYSYFSSDFSFSTIADNLNHWVDSLTTIQFNLTESGTKGDVNYIMTYTNSANGIFSYDGTEYTEGEEIEILPGVKTGLYKGTEEATHELEFTVMNDNHYPVSHSDNLNIVYANYQSDFNIVITPEESDIYVDSLVNIEFNLTEILKNNVNYSMAFTNSSTGVFTYNGSEYNAGDIIEIHPGISNGTYKGTAEATHTLQFVVRNDNTDPTIHIKDVVLNYTYYSSDFNIVGIPSETTVNVNSEVEINFVLSEMLKSDDVSYTMSFTSNGSGSFIYNGTEYFATQQFTVLPGGFSGKYKGTDAQIHNINFTVSNNNHYPTSHSVEVSIEFIDTDFNINVTPTTGDTYPRYRNVNYQLSIDGGGDTETKLIIQELDVDVNSEPEVNDSRQDFFYGSTYPIVIDGNGNDNKINFNAWGGVGTNIYKLKVTKNGIVKTKEITLNILAPPFEITNITSSPNNLYVGDDVTIDITTSTTYSEDIDYNIHCQNGSITADKTVNGTGTTSITMPVGTTSGNQTINIIITNQFGKIITDNIDINVLSTDFAINVSPTNQTKYPKIHGVYNFTVDGGNSSSNTTLKVLQASGHHQTLDNLVINGSNQNDEYGHVINITGVDNNVIKISKNIIETEEYYIEVTKDGVTHRESIFLTCEAPPFEITNITSSPSSLYLGGNTTLNITTTTSYPYDINYDYHCQNGSITADKTVNGTGTTSITMPVGTTSGNQTINIDIENQYGEIETDSKIINVQKGNFDFTLSANTSVWANDNLAITTHLTAENPNSQTFDYTYSLGGHNETWSYTGTNHNHTKSFNPPNNYGIKTLTVSVTDSYSQTETKTKSINIKNHHPTSNITRVSGTHILENNLLYTKVTFDIEGFPTKGSYCTEYDAYFWHPTNNNWQRLPSNENGGGWTLSNNKASYHSASIKKNTEKIRYRVKDNLGTWGEWKEYIKPN